jgi:hypothetical protein
MTSSHDPGFRPLVLIIMGDQWPRALLRAELLETGYEAVGARSLEEGLQRIGAPPERGAVRVVVVDWDSAADIEAEGRDLAELGIGVQRVLVAKGGATLPPGDWSRVLRRPVSIGDIVDVVRSLVPVTVTGSGTIDE